MLCVFVSFFSSKFLIFNLKKTRIPTLLLPPPTPLPPPHSTLEGSGSIVSEQGHRKQLYQRIVAAFPEGWMNSGQISREVSAMKKRFEKEAMDEEP